MAPDRREARQAALRAALVEEGLDGLIVSHLPNIRYLTGFTGTAGALFLDRDRALFLTDFRYEAQAAAEVGDAAAVEIVRTDLWERVQRAVTAAGDQREIGYEAHVITARTADRIREWGRRVRPAPALVERLRASKDAGELEALRGAAELACAAFEYVIDHIRPGSTERDIATELERRLRSAGSEWHPFPTIVASGPRSALPHARTGTRTVCRGDLVLLDFGAQVGGYCADLTRTVVVGTADDRQRAVYDLVRDAQGRAIDGMRSGMSGADADAIARTAIAERGYGEAFGHSLGHGLGLEVHEAPRISRTNAEPLPPDAVVTVEPGIYLPGWGGVRIEDDVHVSVTGTSLLSDGQSELRELT